MALRIEYRTIAPNAVKALAGLNAYSDHSSLSPTLRRLLEILVSRINGCSYCVEVHERQALDLDVAAARIEALESWRSSARFSSAEKAAFAWAENITRISTSGAPE